MRGCITHTKGDVFHINTTCIWKETTGIEPRDTFKRKGIDSTGERFALTSYARLMQWNSHKLEMGGYIIHTKGDVFHTNAECIWKDTPGLEPRDTSKRKCIDPTGKRIAHTIYARLMQRNSPKLEMGGYIIHTKGDVFHTNTTCIWKDTTGIEPRDAPKRKCIDPTGKRLAHTSYARLMQCILPQIRNGRTQHSYKRRRISYKHNMYLKGYN